MKLANEIPKILENKLTKRNILVFLCQIEKILLPWMALEDKEQQGAPTPAEGGDSKEEKKISESGDANTYGKVND